MWTGSQLWRSTSSAVMVPSTTTSKTVVVGLRRRPLRPRRGADLGGGDEPGIERSGTAWPNED